MITSIVVAGKYGSTVKELFYPLLVSLNLGIMVIGCIATAVFDHGNMVIYTEAVGKCGNIM